MEDKQVYRTYTFVIFGPQKVGKTNIVTRFTKNQFSEAHNMTLQGQQNTILNIDGRNFEVFINDTAGQQNLLSMKAVWRSNKDGFIFTFAIDNYQSFRTVVQDIKQIKSSPNYKNVPSILIGNKIDLNNLRKIIEQQINKVIKLYKLKYFEISAKQSSIKQIKNIFIELIDQNQMNQFTLENQNHSNQWILANFPCCKDNQHYSLCQLI